MLVSCPRLFAWFSALAYAGLLTGGIGGRNWVTAGEQERCDRAPVGEDRRREVGRGGAIVTRLGTCGKGGGVAAEPSVARSPMSNWATVAPTRIPSRLRWLLGIALSSVASNWSRLLFAAG